MRPDGTHLVTLDLTPRETATLHELRGAFERAQRDFVVAFTMACAARELGDATLVSLEGAKLAVTVPEDEGDGTGRT